jgi:hypothetical protein
VSFIKCRFEWGQNGRASTGLNFTPRLDAWAEQQTTQKRLGTYVFVCTVFLDDDECGQTTSIPCIELAAWLQREGFASRLLGLLHGTCPFPPSFRTLDFYGAAARL